MSTQINSTLKLIAVSFCTGLQLLGVLVLAGKVKSPLLKSFPSYIKHQILPLPTATE